MFCPNCGSKVNDGARFCSNCGSPLAAGRPSSGTRKPPQAGRDSSGARRTAQGARNTAEARRTTPNARNSAEARRPAQAVRDSSGARRSAPAGRYNTGARRPAPVEEERSGSGRLVLTIVLIVLMVAAIITAVAVILYKKPEKTSFLTGGQNTEQQGFGTAENSDSQATPGSSANTQESTSQNNDSQGAGPGEAAQNTDSQDASTAAQGSKVILDENDFSMTVDGYSTFGAIGYQLNFTFVNKSSRDLCLGYNRPVVNGTVNNTEGSFSVPAGQAFSGTISFNLSGICSPSEVHTIDLPLFVYDDKGSQNPMPSTQQASGSNYINTTVTVNP